jgi:osmoprotectant transport system permease protein
VEQLVVFLGDAANWQNETGIPNRLLEHIVISLLAVLTASVIALPLGFYIGHTGRL